MSISQSHLVKVVKWQMNHIAAVLQYVEKGLSSWRQERLEPAVSSSDPTFTILGSGKPSRPSFEAVSIRINLHKTLKVKEHYISIDKPAYEATLERMPPAHRLAWKAFVEKPTFSKPFLFKLIEKNGETLINVRDAVPNGVVWALKDIWLSTVAPWDQDELNRLREARVRGEKYMAASKIELLEQELNAWQGIFEKEGALA